MKKLSEEILFLRKEIEELHFNFSDAFIRCVEKLENQIELMKNCQNCKYYGFSGCNRRQILKMLKDEECNYYDKWESEIEE